MISTLRWSSAFLEDAVLRMPAAVEEAKSGHLRPARPIPSPMFVEQMLKWDFDIFTVAQDDLATLAYSALLAQPEFAPATRKLKIDDRKMWRYICEVGCRYHNIRPFHSFRHGVDVLLATTSLVNAMRLHHPECFSDALLVAALLVSAIAHDINHPGCANGFLVALESPLTHGSPMAVLERHHADLALSLLSRPELDFTIDMPPEDRRRFTEYMQELILATDVTTTGPKAKAFNDTLNQGGQPSSMDVLSLVIKAADISNPARNLPVYRKWVDAVMTEFFAQGDAERNRGMAISMNCDRTTVVPAKAQVGFISFLVGPLFNSLCTYSPSLKPMVDQLEANKQHFEAASVG